MPRRFLTALLLAISLGGCLAGPSGGNAPSEGSLGAFGGASGMTAPEPAEVAAQAAPTLPSGIAAPAGEEMGNDKWALRSANITFSKATGDNGILTGKLTGRVLCRASGQEPYTPCLSGRILRMANATNGFYIDTALKTDAGGEGYFETPYLPLPTAAIGRNPYDDGTDWRGFVSPADYAAIAPDTLVPEPPSFPENPIFPNQALEDGRWGMVWTAVTVVAEDAQAAELKHVLPPAAIIKLPKL